MQTIQALVKKGFRNEYVANALQLTQTQVRLMLGYQNKMHIGRKGRLERLISSATCDPHTIFALFSFFRVGSLPPRGNLGIYRGKLKYASSVVMSLQATKHCELSAVCTTSLSMCHH